MYHSCVVSALPVADKSLGVLFLVIITTVGVVDPLVATFALELILRSVGEIFGLPAVVGCVGRSLT